MLKKLKRAALGAGVPHEKGTATLATVKMPVPSKVVLPMQQHIGAPCTPVVKKGDTVMVGTLVGKAEGFVSANIYSGVSGTVASVDTVHISNGASVAAVVITPDGQQTVDPAVKAPVVTDKASFIEAIQNCGLVGLGGAGFPTAVKLSPKTPVDTLVINAAECEPYLTADTREMLENGETIASGVKAVMKYLEIKNCVIGIERNKPECVSAMNQLFSGVAGVTVKVLPSRYPQGAEKVLIENTTGREVPQGGLPSDAGVIVMNVTTVSTIGKFLATGMPLVTKRLTVDGDAIKEPKNVEAIIGTPVREVLEFCGLKEGVTVAKLISGGPMMGLALPSADEPVLKQNNGILAFSEKMAAMPAAGPCIRCGRCIEACPMGLAPVQIAGAFNKKNTEELNKLCVDLCMLCGTCSYVCPAKRPVTQTMGLAKEFAKKEAKK
ncbi:electron transport complex subunit RsxC [Allofournierella massiliensis]|uniref:Ion-translocating oxidoreductase complex subunit C n=1 Tax=Allofournierella massiliensis TaxID=1650663 RepID=A0A4R1QGX0_9FIRM|nr:electron transport complex subunit RsxC [Fournierella massiliensis]TCL51760.1 electron transport complex protein RnfC [Fournierella massiliensis]